MSIRRKLVIVGDGNCGKTTLLVTFTRDEFPEIYTPTVFDTYVADVEIDEKFVELSLWDTAGQEDFDRLRPISYHDTHVVLVSFSIDSVDNFENIPEKWAPELNHFCHDVPMILVGTKKDLRYDYLNDCNNNLKIVSPEQGHLMAEKIGAVKYMECSAKTKEGVRDIFEKAARLSLKYKRSRFEKKCLIL